MYKNLKAEMIRQDITSEQIAETLNVKKDTACRKIKGKININIEECRKVCALFKENNSVEYLFKKS